MSKGSWVSSKGEGSQSESGSDMVPVRQSFLFSIAGEEGLEHENPNFSLPVSSQVQVLLYYLQHPPISFAELKRNTLYFSTDV